MFTGIIESKGQVLLNEHQEGANRLILSSSFEQLTWGESIAVNGVCLTLLPSNPQELSFDVSPETLKVTSLADLAVGDFVNLERAMLATSRFGGHYVSGHVDTVASVASIEPIGEYIAIELSGFDAQSMQYLLPKGSITVEGVSLTINAVTNRTIQMMLVPHTLSETTLGHLDVGATVNIEFDYLTRVVAHQLHIKDQLNYEVAL